MKHPHNIGGDGIKMLPLCIKFSLTAATIKNKKNLHKKSLWVAFPCKCCIPMTIPVVWKTSNYQEPPPSLLADPSLQEQNVLLNRNELNTNYHQWRVGITYVTSPLSSWHWPVYATQVSFYTRYPYYSYPYIYMPQVFILAILFAEILHKVEHPVHLRGPLTVMGGL